MIQFDIGAMILRLISWIIFGLTVMVLMITGLLGILWGIWPVSTWVRTAFFAGFPLSVGLLLLERRFERKKKVDG